MKQKCGAYNILTADDPCILPYAHACQHRNKSGNQWNISAHQMAHAKRLQLDRARKKNKKLRKELHLMRTKCNKLACKVLDLMDQLRVAQGGPRR